MAEINLAPEEARKSESFGKVKARVTLASVIILILTALSAFVSLAFFGYFISQREKAIERIESASSTVNNLKEVEELLVVTKDKVAAAEGIAVSRGSKVNVLTTLAQIIPQKVYFTDIKVDDKAISFNGRAATSADVAGLISALQSGDGTKIVSGVSIDTLSSDESGAYAFTITAQAKK